MNEIGEVGQAALRSWPRSRRDLSGEKVAQAQAEALRVQGASIQANPGVLELRRIEVEMKKAQQWNGVLPVNVYAGAPIPFLNVAK